MYEPHLLSRIRYSRQVGGHEGYKNVKYGKLSKKGKGSMAKRR